MKSPPAYAAFFAVEKFVNMWQSQVRKFFSIIYGRQVLFNYANIHTSLLIL